VGQAVLLCRPELANDADGFLPRGLGDGLLGLGMTVCWGRGVGGAQCLLGQADTGQGGEGGGVGGRCALRCAAVRRCAVVCLCCL
jgi:hypothetical protein